MGVLEGIPSWVSGDSYKSKSCSLSILSLLTYNSASLYHGHSSLRVVNILRNLVIPRSTLQGQIQTLYIVNHSAGGWEGPSPQLTSAPSSETLHPPRPRPQMLNRDGHVTKGRQPDSLPPGIWDWESVFRNHELVQLNLR